MSMHVSHRILVCDDSTPRATREIPCVKDREVTIMQDTGGDVSHGDVSALDCVRSEALRATAVESCADCSQSHNGHCSYFREFYPE